MFSSFQQRERQVGQGKRIRRSAAEWRELIAQQSSSGLAVQEVCQREGLNASVFWRWRLRLKRSMEGGRVRARPDEAPFIDLGDLRSGGSRLEVRLDLGAGVWERRGSGARERRCNWPGISRASGEDRSNSKRTCDLGVHAGSSRSQAEIMAAPRINLSLHILLLPSICAVYVAPTL